MKIEQMQVKSKNIDYSSVESLNSEPGQYTRRATTSNIDMLTGVTSRSRVFKGISQEPVDLPNSVESLEALNIREVSLDTGAYKFGPDI